VPDPTKQLDERDERHRAKQLEHQAEISQLKEKLEAMKKENEAEVDKVIASFVVTLSEEKERLEAQVQKYKDQAVNAETERASVQKELTELKGNSNTWLKELTRINNELASKFFLLFISCRHNLHADICLTLTYFPLFSENFPHSEHAAILAVSKARGKRA